MWRSRPLTAIIITVTTISLAIGGAITWRSQVVQKQSRNRQLRAEKLVKAGKAVEALELIGVEERLGSSKEGNDPDSVRWRVLKRDAITRTANAAALAELYQRHPAEIEGDEPASLLLFRTKAIARGKTDPLLAEKLAAVWQEKTTHPEWWLSARADTLIAQGKRGEAEKLLLAHSYPGVADANRLLRLAILNARRPETAWKYVQQAYALTPRNPEVRAFRARLLEGTGQLPQARVEYAAAWLADPRNPMWCDQLAEFYRRHGDLTDAVQTWTDGLSSGAGTDFVWTKALFWSRVAEPLAFPVVAKNKAILPPPGPLQPLVSYLRDLPDSDFWNPEKFDTLMSARRLEKSRQEVHWLTVLYALQKGQEKRALSLIAHSPFRDVSWNPALERALDLTLSYRTTGKFKATGNTPANTHAGEQHTFLGEMERYAQGAPMPEGVVAFLKSDNAISGILLASGWTEAALRLNPATTMESVPEWYVYGITQALRRNRGSQEALTYALLRQHPGPALEVLTAELLVATGDTDQALTILGRRAADTSDAGYRAAWLLATACLDQDRPEDAIRVVERQPALATSETGISIKARAALALNDPARATALYTTIQKDSGEAKVYLAKAAFDKGDFTRARRFTDELLQLYPDAIELRANLRTIQEKQAAQRTGVR